jgi:hypothetical protein
VLATENISLCSWGLCHEKRERAKKALRMNMQVDTWTTRQNENVFALTIKGKEEKEY